MNLMTFLSSTTFWVWVSSLVIGFVLCGWLFWFLRGLLKHPQISEQDSASEESPQELTPWQKRKKSIGYFFARLGYFPKDPLSQSFAYALRLMREIVGGRSYRYRLPWFVMVGAEGDGKTTLIESLRLPLPVGAPATVDRGALCNWWFFDQGVVLDVSGQLVLQKDGLSSREEEWRLLLDLLQNHRSNRPMDGIVLTLSAHELKNCSSDELAARAEVLYSKLWQIQRVLGLKIPVFIIVTHCDLIPGFTSFCHEIPPENRDNAFGWSNPYPLEMPYQPIWCDELFHSLSEQLIYLQQEIFTRGKVYAERDGVLLFPREFENLHEPLSLCLNHLFQISKLSEHFFFRGVYFTGDGIVDTNVDTTLQKTMEESLGNALGATKEDGETSPQIKLQKRSIYFSTALFRGKIFPEKGLVKFVHQRILSNNRALRFFQMGVGFFSLLGFVGLIYSYNRLVETRMAILPSLNRIGYGIQRSLADKNYLASDHAFFQQQAQLIIRSMQNVRTEHLFLPLIPASWLSPLENRLSKVLTVAYNVVILKAIAARIRDQIDEAISGHLPTLQAPQKQTEGVNPIRTLPFLILKQYVDTLTNAQKMILKFNELKDTASLEDFGFIVEQLFKTPLPKEFYQNNGELYRSALSHIQIEPIGFYEYSSKANERLEKLIKDFLVESLSPSKLTPQIESLKKALDEFYRATSSYKMEQLRYLVENLTDSIALFTNQDSKWMTRKTFLPGPDFDLLVKNIVSSNFFSSSVTDDFLKRCETAFQGFRGGLVAYKTPLTGSLFDFKQSAGSSIAPSVSNLQGFLNLLLAQPFMSFQSSAHFDTTIDPGEEIVWNYAILRDVTALIKEFQDFFIKKTSALPKRTQITLRAICLKSLAQATQKKLAAAQQKGPLDPFVSKTTPEAVYLPMVQNLRATTPLFIEILKSLETLGETNLAGQLKEILTQQTLSILERIDFILEEEGPYQLNLTALSRWKGGKGSMFHVFGVQNENELRDRLLMTRQRIRYLAREFIDPPLKLLGFLSEHGSLPGVARKWQSIIGQLTLLDQKSPNSIHALEGFILKDLPNMTLANCPLMLRVVKGPRKNFFMDVLQTIRASLEGQCKNVSQKSAQDGYVKIANFFNKNLSGRYPFVPKGFVNYPDAQPDQVAAFYSLFDKNALFAQEFLKKQKASKPHLEKALLFIKQMTELRKFFRPLTTSPSDKTVEPSLPLQIIFRTNKDHEKNGNQIIAWTVTIGEETFDFSKEKALTRWASGAPITVGMRWALGSSYRPTIDSTQSALSVDGQSATYTFKGCWSLLRMLDLQKAKGSDFTKNEDSNPTTLRFRIPTVLKNLAYPPEDLPDNPSPATPSSALIFMSVKTQKEGGESFEPLALSLFPTEAPDLEALEPSEPVVVKKPLKSLTPDPCGSGGPCPPENQKPQPAKAKATPKTASKT